MRFRSFAVLVAALFLGLALPAPGRAESRLHAKARQTVRALGAATERRDWGAFCHYVPKSTRRIMVQRAQEEHGLRTRKCASAAKRIADPRLGTFRITSIDGKRTPIWLGVIWNAEPDNPTNIQAGPGDGHWVVFGWPLKPYPER
jgi:hypothetical protein